MKTASKPLHKSPTADIGQRLEVSRASVARTRRNRVASDADPILAAIEQHGEAAVAFRNSWNPADKAWVAQQGGDTSPEAMANAEAAWAAADAAQVEAWNALFEIRPTTPAGLTALLRHIGEHAGNMLDIGGTYDTASIFNVLADASTALADQMPGARCCTAGLVASRLGGLANEWFSADAQPTSNPIEAAAIDDRLQVLAEALSYTRAASPAGMLGQLAVAFDAVDMVLNGYEGKRKPAAERAERCLLSVAAAICAASGIDREGYGASYFMSGTNDWMACLPAEMPR